MAEILEYATPGRRSANRRRIGWVSCVISIVIALWMGIGSTMSAYHYRHTFGTLTGRDAENFEIDKGLNEILPPALLLIALIGCGLCWSRKTGAWLSSAALLIGIGGWVASLLIYP